MPPPPSPTSSTGEVLPVIQSNPYGQATEVRYSDFLKYVDANRIEKVTFSADGTQLLGVDTDGNRLAIQALPNDPDLLTQLTNHKVRGTPVVDCEILAQYENDLRLTLRFHFFATQTG